MCNTALRQVTPARCKGGEGVPVAHAIGISYPPHYLLVALGAGFLELKKKEHG